MSNKWVTHFTPIFFYDKNIFKNNCFSPKLLLPLKFWRKNSDRQNYLKNCEHLVSLYPNLKSQKGWNNWNQICWRRKSPCRSTAAYVDISHCAPAWTRYVPAWYGYENSNLFSIIFQFLKLYFIYFRISRDLSQWID